MGSGIKSCDVKDNQIFILLEKDTFPEVAFKIYKNYDATLDTLHASDEREFQDNFRIYALFSVKPDLFITIATNVDRINPSFRSLTPQIYSANWYEREIREMFGIEPVTHPDPRPLVLYDNWPVDFHPLRKDVEWNATVPSAKTEYPFKRVNGEGTLEIPVGPVHAGIIEPGHFRFSVAGEPIINLEIRLGYVHKGIEKLSETMPYQTGVFLAERISGDNSFSHVTAYCQAVEKIANVDVPGRAKYLRTVFLELERLYNLCRDIAGIALVTSYNVGAMHAYIMQEQIMQLNETLTGSRLLRGINSVGGVKIDISWGGINKIKELLILLKREMDDFVNLVSNLPSLLDRTQNTGILTKTVARDLNLVGPVARASGIDRDVRRDHPYAAYSDLTFKVVTQQRGDVQGRFNVKIGEIYESINIIEQALAKMPDTTIAVEVKEIPKGKIGFSLVEAPRGEAIHWIYSGEGRPFRHKIRDPSFCNWLAMEAAVIGGAGNIVPDFPLINKSMNLSYSGNDL